MVEFKILVNYLKYLRKTGIVLVFSLFSCKRFYRKYIYLYKKTLLLRLSKGKSHIKCLFTNLQCYLYM